jgi:hypothetical protein
MTSAASLKPPVAAARAAPPRPAHVAAFKRLLVLLAVNGAFVVGFWLFAKRFEAPQGPDVLDLELAFTVGSFQQILQIWARAHEAGIGAFRLSVVLLDTFFPIAYALFLSRLYVWVVETGGGRPLKTGRWAPWVAGALDVFVENVLLIVLVSGLRDKQDIDQAQFSPWLVFAMSTAAAVKVALLAVTAILMLVALFHGPRGRVLALCRFSAISVVLGSLPLLAVAQGRDLLVALANRQEFVGRFVFFAFLAVWTLSVWYWARVLVTLRSPALPGSAPVPPPTSDELFFVMWTPRILGALTPALAGLAFFRAALVAGDRWPVMVVCAFACLLLAGAFLAFTRIRRDRLQRKDAEDRADVTADLVKVPPSVKRVIWVVLGVSLAFFALFTFWPLTVVPRLGAITVLIVAAANTVFFGSVAILVGRKHAVPLVTVGLLAAAVFSGWNDNHDVRLLAGTEAPVRDRPLLEDAFLTWFEPLRKACEGCSEVPVYLVAAEGGGIRAAYWTAGVLAHLQDRRPEFARHLFAISGVSGGSVGSAVFTSLVKDSTTARESGAGPLKCSVRADGTTSLEQCTRRILAGQFLTPTLARMVAGDSLQWFWPVPVRRFDRGRALEDAWAESYAEATTYRTLEQGYLASWPSPTAGVPALLLNGTHVQTGRRLIAAPFRWRLLSEDPSAPDPVEPGADFPDAYDLLGVLGTDLPLHTAMHNSARFTYVSPAGRLRPYGQDRGHVVDGGYFENSGAVTLRDLVRAVSKLSVTPKPRFVVIYICNSPERCHQPPEEPAGDAAWRPADGLAELLSPLRALLGAREARGSLALAELRQERLVGDFVELGICKPKEGEEGAAAPLPLGWQLSDGVREELDRQVHLAECGAVPVP